MMDLVLFRHVDLHLVYCHAGQKRRRVFWCVRLGPIPVFILLKITSERKCVTRFFYLYSIDYSNPSRSPINGLKYFQI